MKLSALMLSALLGWSGLGCYGYSSRTEIAVTGSYVYRPHNGPVEIFFDDEKPQKTFTQVAMIEIDGALTHTMQELLQKMRGRAQELGADAVIHVRKTTMQRERGFLFDNKSEIYIATVLTGVAIKYSEN